MMDFSAGSIYHRRRDLHNRFGGQSQGGMSTPKGYPVIFLFTGESGAKHGYRDEFKVDGTYHYTGEGQRGDMEFLRANRALRDHQSANKRVYLFEEVGKGFVRYVGEVSYLGYHYEERPDKDGRLRQAIVFELALEPESLTNPEVIREPKSSSTTRGLWGKPLEDLHHLALTGSDKEATPTVRRQVVRMRAEAVRVYVLKRAGGVCEGCGATAPFTTKDKRPYLEPHHTTRLADGGPDHPSHVIALCPTCHRRVHHGHDGEAYNRALIEVLSRIEPG